MKRFMLIFRVCLHMATGIGFAAEQGMQNTPSSLEQAKTVQSGTGPQRLAEESIPEIRPGF